jgi:iron complex transport system substrate-binding protein
MSTTDRQRVLTNVNLRFLLAVLFLFFLSFLGGCKKTPLHQNVSQSGCERVVSLSPSITEVLYALDLGPQVAGVTRYCKFPAEAQKKPQVGGYIDPDSEALLRLKPDLVVLREEQHQLIQQLRGLGFHLLTVDHRNASGILKSIDQVGRACHQEAQARQLRATLERDIAAVQAQIRTTTHRPKVLVVLDRDVQSEKLHWAFVAGEDGFYDWLIENAGGIRAVPAGQRGFMQVSPEGILRMNPDVIIETTESHGPDAAKLSQAQQNALAEKQWRSLPQVSAVKNHRIYHFSQDYMVIPGPRFPRVLEKFAQAIHPEINWKHEPATASATSR